MTIFFVFLPFDRSDAAYCYHGHDVLTVKVSLTGSDSLIPGLPTLLT